MMTISDFLTLVTSAVVLAATMGGCATKQDSGAPGTAAARVTEPRELPVFEGTSGRRVTLEDVIAAAAGADVVMIGENHGHPAGLGAAAAIFTGVLERSQKAALSMEFFERDEQSRLDDYLMGVTEEAGFTKATGRTDSNYPPGHRAMVEAAREKQRPVIAANAPRPYVRMARLKGYDALTVLTAEQRRMFRIPDLMPTGRYRDDFNKIMIGGGSAEKGEKGTGGKGTQQPAAISAERMAQLDATFRSQSMWDWTMAESIVRAQEAGSAPVVHVVGRFHVDFGGGTVQALSHLRPGVRIVTISFVDRAAKALADEDKGRADFVFYAGASSVER